LDEKLPNRCTLLLLHTVPLSLKSNRQLKTLAAVSLPVNLTGSGATAAYSSCGRESCSNITQLFVTEQPKNHCFVRKSMIDV
jgi:hypothetical protein